MSDLAAEVQQVSPLLAKLMKEQAVATGMALASLWMVRYHLWLSMSGEDQVCLHRLPVVPSAMFGPDANNMLQHTQDVHQCAWEMSGMLWQGPEQHVPTAPWAGPSWLWWPQVT